MGTTTANEIQVTDRADPAHWQDYVQSHGQSHRQGALYHQLEWDDVFAVYGLRVMRLAALQGSKIVGVLPLVHQKSLIFGNHMVSLPWFDAAGIMADDPTAETVLLDAALQRCRRSRADLNLRQLSPLDTVDNARTDKILMRLELPEDADALWDSFSPKVRNQVRKAEKSGLLYEHGDLSLLNEFYRVYSTNMRDLGSPPHSQRFFQCVIDRFKQAVRLHVVRKDGLAIGAGMTLGNGGYLEIPWASSLRSFNSLCVNHLLYWNVIKDACTSDFTAFHFGRSTADSGTYRFKRQWGAQPETLHWYTFDASGDAVDTDTRPEEEFGLARRVWQKLPVWLSATIGPRVIAKVA